MALSAGLPADLTWHFSQVFGDRVGEGDISEADIISALEFSHDGEHLATGDKGGRVVVFERTMENEGQSAEYRFLAEFQSHEPEFDYLKSVEIEEKINQIRWLRQRSEAHFLLTTNDKTVKLWKVHHKCYRTEAPEARAGSFVTPLRVPRLRPVETRVESRVKRIFSNAHAYHINSISINSDDETFLSADDLRINVWSHGMSDQCFNLVDIKPANMEQLAEVITSAQFHPLQCNLFMYSTSKGVIRLGDMRASALCDSHAKAFEEPSEEGKNFFSDIIASISDVKFSHDGTKILSRDYLTAKIWDVRMEGRAVDTFKVHEHFRPKLCDLYESDCIFDKFEACWSGDDNHVMTGSYNNQFRIVNRTTKRDVMLEASRDTIEGPTHVLIPMRAYTGPERRTPRNELHVDRLDINQKILHSTWHPRLNIIAIAAVNNLYLFRR